MWASYMSRQSTSCLWYSAWCRVFESGSLLYYHRWASGTSRRLFRSVLDGTETDVKNRLSRCQNLSVIPMTKFIVSGPSTLSRVLTDENDWCFSLLSLRCGLLPWVNVESLGRRDFFGFLSSSSLLTFDRLQHPLKLPMSISTHHLPWSRLSLSLSWNGPSS